jgi:hypothetical protein
MANTTISDSLNNTGNYINQLEDLGVINPPNGGSFSAQLAKMANVPRVDTTDSLTAAAACRKNYTGFGGLRKLQADQKNMTHYDSRCAWMYNQGTGINPIVNRGVLTTPGAQPIFGGRGQPDEQQGGSVTMNLRSAERAASAGVANTLGNNCRNLAKLSSENQDYFGFCKTSGKIIPIEISAGYSQARFPNDMNLNCAPENIVSAANAATKCPASTSEGFNDIQKQLECKIPLSRDCVLRAARESGCTDKGAIVDALTGSADPAVQYRNMNSGKAYSYYLEKLPNNDAMNQMIMGGGRGVRSLTDAYDIFNALAQTASAPSEDPGASGIYSAARDLCLEKGFFKESYNFCSELSDDDVINGNTIECVQNIWRNAGGTSKGSAYPTLNSWNGKKVRDFRSWMEKIVENLNIMDKKIQANAIKKFIGTDSSSPVIIRDLDMNDNTRGVETTWIYFGDKLPIIIRSDMSLAKDNETMPLITSTNDLKYKYRLPTGEFISFVSFFEYRPPTNTTVNFSVTTDDGFMVGYNQNPFERTNNLDWGSWALQAPTTHRTPRPYQIDVTKPSNRNKFIVKWFQNAGLAVFNMSMADGSSQYKSVATDRSIQQNTYLTQEPNAPWLQYEVCPLSPIKGGGMAFCEKRFRITDRPFTSESAFDSSMTGGASLHTEKEEKEEVPGNKGYMSLTANSSWKTLGKFSPHAFKTITMLVRPKYSQSSNLGILFYMEGFIACLIGREGSKYYIMGAGGIDSGSTSYHEYIPNEWNILVIQYVDTDGYGIRNVTTNCCALSKLVNRSQRQAFVDNLNSRRNTSSPIFKPTPRTVQDLTDYRGSGSLIIGMNGCNVDIAWLHGFRNYFTTEEDLKAEINSSWVSRWEPTPTVSGFKDSSPTPVVSSTPKKPEGFFSQFKW